MAVCAVITCIGPEKARGWCNKHYLRWWRLGDPLASAEHIPIEARFWSKVQRGKGDECWLWIAAINAKGYGIFSVGGGKSALAHRVSYELITGEMPEYDRRTRYPLTLDHLCRNRTCVNPAHLEPVTSKENTARGSRAMATHCIRGHLFDNENTFVQIDAQRRQHRRCQRCRSCPPQLAV